jgi:hypothetical protein
MRKATGLDNLSLCCPTATYQQVDYPSIPRLAFAYAFATAPVHIDELKLSRAVF